MNKYKVLVADDEYEENETYYELLLSDDRFVWEHVQSRADFDSKKYSHFDAVILDINLKNWDLPLTTALQIIGRSCPILLASFAWDNPVTGERVRESLAGNPEVRIVQTMSLSELKGADNESYVAMLQVAMWLALSSERRLSTLRKTQDESFEILLVSDPQYGDPNQEDWAEYVERELPKFISSRNKSIDLLAITGDIAYQGSQEDYITAEKKISDLVSALWPTADEVDRRERILLVPGNHDVDFRIEAANHIDTSFNKDDNTIIIEPRELNKEDLKSPRVPANYKMQPFRDFCYRLTSDDRWLSSKDLCWINDSFLHLGLRFILLNSAHGISCLSPSHADIPKSATDRERLDTSREIFTVALSHHGPLDTIESSIESLESWPRISKFFGMNEVKLLLHGHAHRRTTCTTALTESQEVRKADSEGRLTVNEGEIGRVMAPTTHLDEVLRPLDERGFMILSIKRENGKAKTVIVDSFDTSDNGPKQTEGYPIHLIYD